MAKKTISVFVEDRVREGLRALATAQQRSLSQMCAILLTEVVDKAVADGTLPKKYAREETQ